MRAKTVTVKKNYRPMNKLHGRISSLRSPIQTAICLRAWVVCIMQVYTFRLDWLGSKEGGGDIKILLVLIVPYHLHNEPVNEHQMSEIFNP